MQLKDLKSAFENELHSLYDREEAFLLMQLALEKVLNLSYQDIKILAEETNIVPNDQERLLMMLNDLKLGIPIQHIIGEAHFYGSVFKVGSDVLIPRPETEELVDWIISDFSNRKSEKLSILDVGTGSGCIPIILKKNLVNFNVTTLDISSKAIAIAKENAKNIGSELNFIEADILNYESTEMYDIMVSNPPYIRQLEKADMHKNVVDFEPHLALFVSDADPLIFYRKIADFAQLNLKENGVLFLEINEYLAKETIQLLLDKHFKNIELRKDMQGKDRMIKAFK